MSFGFPAPCLRVPVAHDPRGSVSTGHRPLATGHVLASPRAIIARCCDWVSGGWLRPRHRHDRRARRASALPGRSHGGDIAMTGSFAKRPDFLPFSRPTIRQVEIDEVVDSLRSGWITTGPKAERFESDFAAYTGFPHVAGALLGDRGAAHRPDRPRPEARRRGDHHADDLGLDGQHDRGRGGDAGLRRHPPRHAADRRAPARSGRHAAHGRHHPGALRRRAGRHGRDPRRRAPRTACGCSRTRRTASVASTRAPTSAASTASACSPSTRSRT